MEELAPLLLPLVFSIYSSSSRLPTSCRQSSSRLSHSHLYFVGERVGSHFGRERVGDMPLLPLWENGWETCALWGSGWETLSLWENGWGLLFGWGWETCPLWAILWETWTCLYCCLGSHPAWVRACPGAAHPLS